MADVKKKVETGPRLFEAENEPNMNPCGRHKAACRSQNSAFSGTMPPVLGITRLRRVVCGVPPQTSSHHFHKPNRTPKCKYEPANRAPSAAPAKYGRVEVSRGQIICFSKTTGANRAGQTQFRFDTDPVHWQGFASISRDLLVGT